MGRGRVMASIWEELGIDLEEVKKGDIQKEKEFKYLDRTIKSGSGIKPESLKLYNRHMSFLSGDSIIAREYHAKSDMYDAEIDALLYGINCIQEFCQSIFGIEIEAKDAATIEYSEFQRYYEEGSNKLDMVKEFYPIAIKAIKMAHTFTDNKLENAVIVLKALDQEVPRELTFVMYFQKKYAKNQHKSAIKDLVKELIPQINNKIILEQIAINSLY